MQKNKITTYLLYAIGEIVLVVIGILIAVSLNNWNEELKSKKRQDQQLLLISNEMKENLTLLDFEAEELARNLADQKKMITLLNRRVSLDSLSEFDLNKLYFNAYNDPVGTPIESVAINELIASGGLKEIKNEMIKHALSSWNSKLLELRVQESSIEKSYQLMTDYFTLTEDFSMRLYVTTAVKGGLELNAPENQTSNKYFFSTRKFENIAIMIYGQSKVIQDRIYPAYRQDLIKMIELLEKELN